MSSLPQTIPALVASVAEQFGEADAMIDGDTRLTFAQFAAAVDRSAKAFIASGLEPGDRAAVWAPNIWEWAIAALGIHTAGGVLIPVNTRWKGGEAGYALEKAGARMLFTVTDFLDTDYPALLEGVEGLDALGETVILRGSPGEGTPFADFLARGDGVSDADLEERKAAIAGDDLCDVLFTSGTTGKPKGAMLRHAATIRAYHDWATVVGLREGDRYLIVNPFFHAFGLKAGIIASLVKGATMLPHPVFDVPQVMQRVSDDRITMLPGPPAVFQTILNHPDRDRFDLSSLRLSVTGAAAIPVEMIIRMRDELKFETVVTGYGLTEATGIATMCRHDDDPETIAKTSGRAIPDVEVVVVDPETGAEVGPEVEGEVRVRGYNVMAGFFDDPDATAEAIDADGWLHTGDIGVKDANGNLRITDRLKDMFIMGGFNVYPAEIENIMSSHSAVAQVAVVGVPDDRMGEVGLAFVVPRADTTLDVDELLRWCRENMANYKVPRGVEVVDALPLNASGKVLKYELRDRAASS